MSPRSGPLVTIIVATYNAGDLLQGCIDSVRAQGADIAELIVMDGGSSDATLDVVRRNADSVAHWESAPDDGIADAWNKGLEHVRGRWVLFMGADDRLAGADVLDRFRPALEGAPSRLAVFGKVLLRGGPWNGYTLGEPWRWRKFRLRMTIPHQGTFHNVRLFEEYGRFDSTIRMAADYEMLLRPGAALDPLFVDEVVAVMGGEGASISSPRLTFREARDAQLRHRVAPSALIHSFHAYTNVRSWLRRVAAGA
jgi:glycosyltransferase involved in cell wall biosynthesis